MSFLKSMAKWPPAYFGLAMLSVYAFIVAPQFLSPNFVLLVLRQAAPLGLVAIGQAFVIRNRSLDLSVGGLLLLTHVALTSRFWPEVSGAILKLTTVLMMGTLLGMLNGILVAKLRASAVVLTLGMGAAYSGLAFVISGGTPGNPVDPLIVEMGRSRVATIPTAAWIWIGFTVFAFLWFKIINYGMRLKLVGSNERAANFVGVNVDQTFIISHTLCGFFVALASVLLSGVIGVGTMDFGQDLVLESIVAVIFGGIAFGGGRGGVFSVCAGAILIVFLSNLLNVTGVEQSGKLIIQGLIIIIATGIFARRQRS